MGVIDLLNHLINFVLPALALGSALPWSTWFTAAGRRAQVGLRIQLLANTGAGILVLGCGLLVWGRDGKMLTYLAMAVVCATVQWLILRAWRA